MSASRGGEWIGLLVIALICGIIGGLIGSTKGRTTAGFWWSFFLGIIGIVIALFLKPADKSLLISPRGWYPDPSGRHELRQWSGKKWTKNVADDQKMAVDSWQTPPKSAPVTVTSMGDSAETLRQLGELHDAGVIDDAEFAAKKTEILGRM